MAKPSGPSHGPALPQLLHLARLAAPSIGTFHSRPLAGLPARAARLALRRNEQRLAVGRQREPGRAELAAVEPASVSQASGSPPPGGTRQMIGWP